MEQEEMVRRFLLGAVTEDEREQIQDQVFLSSSLFEKMELMEDQLTDEYLYGKLNAEEVVRFESYFLIAPQRREKLRMVQELRQYASNSKSLQVTGPSRFEWISAWTLQWRTPVLGLTLAILVGLMSWLLLSNLGLRNEVDDINRQLQQQRAELQMESQSGDQSKQRDELSQQIQAEQRRSQELLNQLDELRTQTEILDKQVAYLRKENKTLQAKVGELISTRTRQDSRATTALVALLEPDQSRGSDKSNIVRIEPGVDEVELHLLLEDYNYKNYSAELRDANGKVIILGGRLPVMEVADGRAVAVRIRSDLLKRGDYVLRLNGLHKREGRKRVASYQFKVD